MNVSEFRIVSLPIRILAEYRHIGKQNCVVGCPMAETLQKAPKTRLENPQRRFWIRNFELYHSQNLVRNAG